MFRPGSFFSKSSATLEQIVATASNSSKYLNLLAVVTPFGLKTSSMFLSYLTLCPFTVLVGTT